MALAFLGFGLVTLFAGAMVAVVKRRHALAQAAPRV